MPALDGVFDADHPDGIVFYPLDAPCAEELLRIGRDFARRLKVVIEPEIHVTPLASVTDLVETLRT